MQNREAQISQAITAALGELGANSSPIDFKVERPAREEHGDFSSNVALAASKILGENPRVFAEKLLATRALRDIAHLDHLEIAGPGFINFQLNPSHLHESLSEIISEGEALFGSSNIGNGEKVQIEFVSANPTGPLHIGNGWWASYGDSLARILRRLGYLVSTEYYVNDTGGQIRSLGESLLARRSDTIPPEGGYLGAYVTELAKRYQGPEDILEAGRWAAEQNLRTIKLSLEKLGIYFDEWYSQASIEESGAVATTVELLQERGAVFEEEGALWLRSTDFGDSRDRVLRKSDGDYSYLAGDIAYHRNKFLIRNFDRVIDVFGADHHGQVASLKAAMAALGIDPTTLEIRIGQMVSILEGDEKLRLSKRKGNIVALDWLTEELGPSAARLYSLSTSIDRATTIDLDKARASSMENPVYYIQYAHARIASIGRIRKERDFPRLPSSEIDLSLLVHPREIRLMKELVAFPEVVQIAGQERVPHKVVTWLSSAASAFHGFYHDCQVLGEPVEPELTQARLSLVEAAQISFRVGLSLLGVDALEQM